MLGASLQWAPTFFANVGLDIKYFKIETLELIATQKKFITKVLYVFVSN